MVEAHKLSVYSIQTEDKNILIDGGYQRVLGVRIDAISLIKVDTMPNVWIENSK